MRFNDNLALLDRVVCLIKKIFCMERSATFDAGESKELEQAIEIALYASTQTSSTKHVEGLLNVLLSVPDQPKLFLESLQRCLSSFIYMDSHLSMLDYLFKWLGLKLDFMLKRGVTPADFEELRASCLLFITDKTPAQTKTAIF